MSPRTENNEGDTIGGDCVPLLTGCPFCGGQPVADHVSHWTGMQSIIVGGRFRHHCGSRIYIEVNGKTVDEATDLWNRRAALGCAATSPSPKVPQEPKAPGQGPKDPQGGEAG